MDIQKEVNKFEAKKSKLVQDFTVRIGNFINSKMDDNVRIRDTMKTLEKQEGANLDQIEEAGEALKKAYE